MPVECESANVSWSSQDERGQDLSGLHTEPGGQVWGQVVLERLGLTGCDHRHQSLLGRCGEEDKEGDELGSDADEEAEGGRTPEMCRARSSAEGAQRETHLRSSSTGGFRVRM